MTPWPAPASTSHRTGTNWVISPSPISCPGSNQFWHCIDTPNIWWKTSSFQLRVVIGNFYLSLEPWVVWPLVPGPWSALVSTHCRVVTPSPAAKAPPPLALLAPASLLERSRAVNPIIWIVHIGQRTVHLLYWISGVAFCHWTQKLNYIKIFWKRFLSRPS